MQELATVEPPEPQLDGSRVRIKEGSLAEQIALDALPSHDLPPEMPTRHALHHERVLRPVGNEHPRGPCPPGRLQPCAGLGLRLPDGLGFGGLCVKGCFNLASRAHGERLEPLEAHAGDVAAGERGRKWERTTSKQNARP